ncbi:MAG: NUDIX domain-containing protein, partial [Chloroflexi bacterium]
MITYCSNCGSKTEPRLVAKQDLRACPKCDRIFFRNPKVVVIALIEDAGRVLLGRRDIEPGRGLWGLPGGYVDWNEHPEAALVREC